MSDVVVIALTAERISAALRTTVRTNCSTTIGAFCHGSLAAWHTYVVISEFNLTELVHSAVRFPSLNLGCHRKIFHGSSQDAEQTRRMGKRMDERVPLFQCSY